MNDVERVYKEIVAIKAVVEKEGGPSDISALTAISVKYLILSAASFFERKIVLIIENAAADSGSGEVAREFIKRQALTRKFHAMFK